MDRNTRKGAWGDRMRGFIVACAAMLALAAGFAGRAQAQVSPGCTATGVCVTAGPRLVSIDNTQGPLLNLLLQALLPGSNVNVSVLDWNAIADADINLNALLIELGADATLSNASQVLESDITLNQLLLAMANVLAADGNTADAAVLQALAASLPGLTGTIQLDDLLQIDLPQGSLADIDLDVLDLVTGSVQLYNYQNVLATPAPVTISTAALGGLGLGGLANAQLWLQVVEPPVYVCGSQGTQFHTAAVRTKLNVEVVDGFTTLAPVVAAINALGLASVSNVSLAQGALVLDVYATVARAQGTIGQVDALAQAINVDVEPGIVDVYIGEIDDAVFFNRTETIEPADFGPLAISTLTLNLDVMVVDNPFPIPDVVAQVQVPLTVSAKASGEADPGSQLLVFTGPYPQTQTVDSGAIAIGALVTDLLDADNLVIEVAAGAVTATVAGIPVDLDVLSDIVDLVTPIVAVVESTLDSTSDTLLAPALNLVLGGLVDPILDLLGIGIGQAVVTVEGYAQSCAAVLSLVKVVDPANDPGRFNLSIRQGATVLASATDVGNNGATGTVVSTPGESYDFAETAGTGTVLDPYVSSWACTDQAGGTVGSGSGGTFTLAAPALASAPQTITCRITNRARQANLSITKSDGSATYTPGGTATYVITVSNAGPDAVAGALVSDTLPAGATLSSAWTCTPTNGSCNPASGGAAGDGSVSLSVDLDAGGQAQITVPVSYSNDPTDY